MKRMSILVIYRDKEYKLIPYNKQGRCNLCILKDWDTIACSVKLENDVNCVHPIKGYWKETFRSKWKRFIKNNIVDDYPYDESHSQVRYGAQ